MLQKIKRKKSLLLTAVILAATSVPSYAAEKKPEKEKIKTDAVVVTASRTEQEVKETPTAVEVITRKDIEKMGAESLRQALQLAFGLDMLENSMVGNNVSIRGAMTNQTLILIDGRRVRSEDTGSTMNFYELDRINMDDVERIEIVRGAASSLYGSEAVGGVINIIRKKLGEQKTSVTTDWTSYRKDGGIRYDAGKHGKWNLAASFKVTDYRQSGVDVSSTYGKKNYFHIEGSMDVAADKYLDVFVDYLKEDLHDKGVSYSRRRPPIYYKSNNDHTRFSTGVKYKGSDKRGDYEMQVYYTRFNKDRNQRNRFSNKLLNFDDMTFNSLIFDARRSMQLTKDHLLTYGGEYRKEDYESTRITGNGATKPLHREGIDALLGKSTVKYTALYVQDEWLLSPDWLLIPSLRFDHSSSFGGKVTGKLATTYKINKDLRFKANIGTAYRAPTASELYLDWPGMGPRTILKGNPNLKPETALNFDLGFEFEKGKTFAKATYFHNKVDDMIATDYSIDYVKRIMTIFHVNKKEAVLQGVELEVKQKLGHGFSLRGLYNYLDARDGKNERIPGGAYHTVSMQLGYEDEQNGWDATLWNNWLAGYYLQKKDYAISTLNFVVSKKLDDRFSAYLGVDNILDVYSDEFAYDGRIWRGGVRMTF